MDIEPHLRLVAPKKRGLRFGKVLPPPRCSACMYVRIAPHDVAMFKFLLEAEDNLGYMSVVDRWRAALKVVFSPHQEKEIRAWLKAARQALEFEEIWLNRGSVPETVPEQDEPAVQTRFTVVCGKSGL